MKNKFLILNIILSLLIIVGDVCYIEIGQLWIKGVTSAGFVLLGAVNLTYLILLKSDKIKFAIIMLIGLVFAMLGDIVLNIHFISGAILFAIGHVFYFLAYCNLFAFKWIDLIYGAIIFIPSVLFITLAPIFDFGGVLMEIVCVVYAIIISCMVGKSISNVVKERNPLTIILLVGSIMFFFSDLMLLLNVFGDLGKITDILCLATYYPAQILLAFSLLNYWNKNNNDLAKKEQLQ